MNLRQAIARIRRFKPTTVEEFAQAGLSLEILKTVSVFREVYLVKDLPLVVKFPLWDKDGNTSEGRRHTNAEIRRIAKMATVPKLRKYLPRIYYHDPKAGIVVARRYPDYDKTVDPSDTLGRFVERLIKDFTGIKLSDVHEDNVRSRDGSYRGCPILLDCGY